MERKTKIIATLGPSTDAEGVVRELIESGVDVVRFNMSHGNHEQHRARFAQLDAIRRELGRPIAALLDTKGPEVRTGVFPEPATLVQGSKYTLTTRDVPGNEGICSISYPKLPKELAPGSRVLISDGLIELRVDAVVDTEIICTVINGGTISSNKGINCPGIHYSMPYLSERDRADLLFGKEMGFDYIAASFARSADDIRTLRAELERIGWHGVRIIAKIENAEGVANMQEILAVSDGVMVARGDMGVEIALEEIPILQKKLIKQTAGAGKQVVTATQMLESMIGNPRPTRAESTDVANAIYDGTSAIMLSGETAAGKYPVEAVRTMSTIATRTEADIHYQIRFKNFFDLDYRDITTAISHATVATSYDLGAKAIITVTKSGYTARMISRFRPACPIISCTPDERVWRQMNLSWGVKPMMIPEMTSTDDLFEAAVNAALESGLVSKGDVVVITAGVPIGVSGNTNLIRVATV